MPFRLLVVDLDDESRAALERALMEAGHLVTSASGYHEGNDRLEFAPPDLLVTALKLGWYNGLQLVIRAHTNNPTMPAIVIHDQYDAVLEKETIAAGAVYLYRAAAVDEALLVRLVEELLADRRAHTTPPLPRKWPRKPASMSVTAGGEDARLVNVSYSGLRLELSAMPSERLSRTAIVYIPRFGFLPVHLVWARGGTGATGRWWCGAEVSGNDQRTTNAWRRFVDALN